MRLIPQRRIAIVLPNYNGEKYLESAILGFLNQNYENKKLFIIDGKSKDSSWKIIEKYADNKTVTWIKEIDTNCANAINIATRYTEDTDIWGFLGCDDILLSGVFEKVASLFATTPLVNGVYFDSYGITVNPYSCNLRQCPQAPFTAQALARFGTIAGLQNIYLDCALFKRFGINEERRFASDYELYFQLAKLDHLFMLHYPMPSLFSFYDGNITSQNARASTRDAVRVAMKYYRPTLRLIIRYFRTFLPNYCR